MRLRPHKSQYWLTSKDKREDPEPYQADVEKLCDLYRNAPQLAAEGAHVVRTDEKTGMQALERLHETKPGRPGLVERVEFPYIRHGTLCLMANFDVVTGRLVSPTVQPTRTEADFAAHVERTITTDPAASNDLRCRSARHACVGKPGGVGRASLHNKGPAQEQPAHDRAR